MKKKLILIVMLSSFYYANAQTKKEEEKEKGFKKENLFTGGNVTLSFGSGYTVLGASPIFGYRLANWIDAGVVVNYIYTSQRDVYQFNDKIRQSTYGGGVFTRLFPVNFLFAQAQFEHNFTTVKYIPAGIGTTDKYKADANSLLVGAGYTQGRERGSNTFFYVAVLFDVLKNENSPYVDVVSDGITKSVRIQPIIRAGFNIGLFEGRDRGSRYR
ncbi:MAG: hypothetical protein ACM3H8_16495 [Sphingobacteriales bacterium]